MTRDLLPVLFVNQSIGPLFADLVAASDHRFGPVHVFSGLTYRRSPVSARLLTWLGFSLQLAWHLFWHGHRYQRVLVVSNPPLAPLLAPLARRPYALLLYDIYPRILEQLQVRHSLLQWALEQVMGIWRFANSCVFARAERIFTLSEAMAAELKPAFATEALWRQKVVVIPPWADTTSLRPNPATAQAFRKRHQLDAERLLITYSGNLGLTHPLEPLLEAAALLREQSNPPLAQMLLIGQGPKRIPLEILAGDLDLPATNLRFLDPLPYSELSASLSAADLAVVALDGPVASASLPSKTFSALACGTPLLVLAPITSALAELVQENRCGLVIEPGPGAARKLVTVLSSLAVDPERLRQMANNALAASCHFTPANAERLLESWLGDSAGVPRRRSTSYSRFKFLADRFAALLGLLLLSPLLLLLALLVRCKLGSPVLFRQQRPGLYGRPFQLLKFRTMTEACDAEGNLLPDAERLTCLGRWLRSTSLDELPELWNILRGEMSFVGPRPLLMEYLPLYSPEQFRRLHVRPGITGWAQVNGRNTISWEDKFCLDVWYIDHQNLYVDLWIIILTVWKVIRCVDINHSENLSMPKFRGR